MRLQPVATGLFHDSKKLATGNCSPVATSPVQSSFQSFCSPMDWTFKLYLQHLLINDFAPPGHVGDNQNCCGIFT